MYEFDRRVLGRIRDLALRVRNVLLRFGVEHRSDFIERGSEIEARLGELFEEFFSQFWCYL